MGARYTRQQMEEAARTTTRIDDAVRWCGRVPTPARCRYLRAKMGDAGIDTSHFIDPRVRHTESALREAVAVSRSIKEVVRRLGINPVGGNHAHISRRIRALGIDTSHFTVRHRRGPQRPPNELLTVHEPGRGRIPGTRLRGGLLAAGRVERCALCGTGPEWNAKPLRLEVDHVNGIWWDNRPDNLRLLCPNCHSVTDTYRGRRRRSE